MLSVAIFEANLIGNSKELYIDTKAPLHICFDKKTFSSYAIANERQLYTGNSTTSTVVSNEKVVVKMTLSKEILLNDMLHVLNICKNLIFGSLLSKNGFKLVFEINKFILTK